MSFTHYGYELKMVRGRFHRLARFVGSGSMNLLSEASVLNLHSPDTAQVEVTVRDIYGRKWILLAPTDSSDS